MPSRVAQAFRALRDGLETRRRRIVEWELDAEVLFTRSLYLASAGCELHVRRNPAVRHPSIPSNRFAPTAHPVSYTHLDVYKRQVERLPWDPPPLLEELALRPKAAKKKKEPPKVPPPPPGPPPSVPDDWLLISGYPQDHLPGEKPNEPPPTPPILDDWTLVRWPGGHAGWILDRMLYLSIPDEVVQYLSLIHISPGAPFKSSPIIGLTSPTFSRSGLCSPMSGCSKAYNLSLIHI